MTRTHRRAYSDLRANTQQYVAQTVTTAAITRIRFLSGVGPLVLGQVARFGEVLSLADALFEHACEDAHWGEVVPA